MDREREDEPEDRETAGRLREQGFGLADHEEEEVADEAEDDTEDLTAEEQAVRVEEDPGGTTGGPDRYVEEDRGRES
jgi:hypothetical protein